VRVREFYRTGVFTVDAGDSLAGIVTERDLARAVADQADPATTPVGYYLTAEPAVRWQNG
jgi:CBS domain-containing protein